MAQELPLRRHVGSIACDDMATRDDVQTRLLSTSSLQACKPCRCCSFCRNSVEELCIAEWTSDRAHHKMVAGSAEKPPLQPGVSRGQAATVSPRRQAPPAEPSAGRATPARTLGEAAVAFARQRALVLRDVALEAGGG